MHGVYIWYAVGTYIIGGTYRVDLDWNECLINDLRNTKMWDGWVGVGGAEENNM